MFTTTFKCTLLLTTALLLGVSEGQYLQSQYTFDSSSAHVHLFEQTGDGSHSFHVKYSQDAEGMVMQYKSENSELCLKWSNSSRLTVSKADSEGKRTVTAVSETKVEICFDLKGAHLYGGPYAKKYPAELAEYKDLAYITGDMSRSGVVMPVTERYWYSSAGLNIKVDPKVPLFIDQGGNRLCLRAKNEFPYDADAPLQISYETCVPSRNVREAVNCFFKSYEKPIPPESVIASPIWSTWVEYKTNITQEKAIDFFNKIKSYNLKLSVMEIDDDWETCYGSQTFNLKKFPDPKAMVDHFHSEGYLTTLWVHPFIGPRCEDITPYAPYLVKYPNGTIGETVWWNGKGHLINFYDPATIDWYIKRLKDIQKNYGFDSFKFDAGEAAYIPGVAATEHSVRLKQPGLFTHNYVKAAANFGSLAEARVGSEAYKYKLMQRLQDTNSEWGAENWGLRSVITSVLQLSLHGYGAILPDMVGGNNYGKQPSKELFIRWVQVNTFLPIFQFSLGPWYFDEETVNITRHFTNLHYNYKDRIVKEFKDLSHPVINPIWWIAPEDTVALGIDDEFLLGTDLLVAPVVHEGAVSRNIYLPKGAWKDANTGKTHHGPGFLWEYSAPLDTLPYFERVSS